MLVVAGLAVLFVLSIACDDGIVYDTDTTSTTCCDTAGTAPHTGDTGDTADTGGDSGAEGTGSGVAYEP